jgi:hypothetical protein
MTDDAQVVRFWFEDRSLEEYPARDLHSYLIRERASCTCDALCTCGWDGPNRLPE